MSRSYKHTPANKFGGYGSWAKRQASKKVRKTEELGRKSRVYKHAYGSYYIRDFRFFCSQEEGEKDLGEKLWRKCYYRK